MSRPLSARLQLDGLLCLASCHHMLKTLTSHASVVISAPFPIVYIVVCVQAYGSFVSGLYSPSGDLDITIEGEMKRCALVCDLSKGLMPVHSSCLCTCSVWRLLVACERTPPSCCCRGTAAATKPVHLVDSKMRVDLLKVLRRRVQMLLLSSKDACVWPVSCLCSCDGDL